MNQNMEKLILTFFLANAIFWGLFPHNAHCLLLENINKFFKTNVKCPEHEIHLLMGLVFYIISVYYAQKNSIKNFHKLMTR